VKKVYVLLISLLSFFMVSCSNLDMDFGEASMFCGGGVLYIQMIML